MQEQSNTTVKVESDQDFSKAVEDAFEDVSTRVQVRMTVGIEELRTRVSLALQRKISPKEDKKIFEVIKKGFEESKDEDFMITDCSVNMDKSRVIIVVQGVGTGPGMFD